MPNIIRNVGNLHDQDTGALTGYVNPVTGKEEALDATPLQALVSGAGSRARYAFQLLNAGRPLRLESWGNSWENSAVLWNSFVAASGGKLGWVDEQGVSGERPDEILTRLRTTGPSPTADAYTLGEGTNAAYSGYTVATYIGYMRNCLQILIATGKPVILRTTPPTTGDAPAQALTHQYWLAEIILAEQLGIICLDLTNRVVATDGQIISAANDGTNKHLNSYYYALCGQDGWTDLDAGSPVRLIPRTNASLGYGGSNVLLLTDSNADNRPDAWSTFYGGTFTSGPTWATLTDLTYPYRGKRASVAMNWPSGIAYVNRSDVAMAGQDGKTVRVSGMLKTAANTSNNGVTVVEVLTYTAGSVLTGTFRVATLVGTTGDLYLQTDFVVPAGTTKYTLTFRTSGSAAGATAVTLEFGCWDVVPVTDYTF